MESLYRKYRPQTFDDVVGQSHVVETLEHAVLEGRTSHAYLFCGPRGTGKTTMARLLAKALMCEQGPGHLPDGTCEQCRLIAQGEHPDVYELDAASRTGVDNVREEIINRVNYAPARGRCKVYIIDEVHMLTTAAFNALLKTLEEPPSHVVFILCTTDPQKIPATILSRVQRFDFHAIGSDDMRARLAYVCEQEGFAYDGAALDLIVRHARGGMRDALSTLEQLSVFGDGEVSLAAAQDLLGEVPGSSLCAVSSALAARDVATLFDEVARLVDAGRDLLQFVRELAAHMRDVYVVAAVGDRPGVVQATGEDLESVRREAAAFGSADRVARILAILADASGEMRTATNQRLVLEVALTRMARPETDLTLEALSERVDELERQVAALSKPWARAAAARPAPDATAGAQQPRSQRRPAAESPVAEPQRAESPKASQGKQRDVRAEAQPQRRQQQHAASQNPQPARQADASPAAVDEGQLQRRWKEVVDTLMRTSASRGSLLMSSSIVSDDGSTLQVSLPEGSGFALHMLERGDVRSMVDSVVAQVFGQRKVAFVEAGSREAGAKASTRRSRRRQAPTRASQAAGTRRATEQRPSVQRGGSEASALAPAQGDATPSRGPAGSGATTYQMPWEGPSGQAAPRAPQAEEVPYEAVPYDEASAASYDEGFAEEGAAVPARQQRPNPARPSRPDGKGRQAGGRGSGEDPTSTVVPSPARTEARDASAPSPAKPAAGNEQQEHTEAAPASDAPRDAPGAGDASRSIPDDIPPDLIAIVESAFDVFGDGVKISKA